MINLLPETHKSDIQAARANVLLVRYIAILGAALVVLGGIVTAAYVVLENRKVSAQDLLDANTTRTAKYQPVRAEADSLRTSIASAKSILDQKVSYTKLIYKIADSTPNGVILDTLELDPTTFGNTTMIINATAKTVEAAQKLRDDFSSTTNSGLFSDVKLLTLESGADDGTGGDYPVKVSVSVMINKGALQ